MRSAQTERDLHNAGREVDEKRKALKTVKQQLAQNAASNSPATESRSGTLASVQIQLDDTALNSDEDDEDDDADEFFDAVDAGSIAVAPAAIEANKGLKSHLFDVDTAPYSMYKQPRTKLPIDSFVSMIGDCHNILTLCRDDRPTVGLWGILKSSIGKDLTRISLPVCFNEPTSMLQRMAEDMEYSACLDHAAAQTESSRRLAYVAAFAMSNYSSTVGRIAKPFNPQLSVTCLS